MSVTTIYKCDRCHGEQDTPVQFWNVGVVVTAWAGREYRKEYPDKTMDVCRSCCENMGLVMRLPKHPELTPPPTLEDLIREIVQQEIQQ